MKLNSIIIYFLTVFLITKPTLSSEVIITDHPEPNLIVALGDIIHKQIYNDQSGNETLILIIKFELKLWKCIITNVDPNIKSTSQCSSIHKDGLELPTKLK